MKVITVASFNGGQGKSSTVLHLGRILAERFSTLLIDCEPQSSLTTWMLGDYLNPQYNSVREVLEGQSSVEDATFQITENLGLLPADATLIQVEASLASSGRGATLLRKRLKQVADHYDYVVVDTPPETIQLGMTALGAADHVLIPATSDLKGVQALSRTVLAIQDMASDFEREIPILGVLPYKVPLFGHNISTDAQSAIAQLEAIAEQFGFPVFPKVIRSEAFEKALTRQQSLQEVGKPHLEAPFQSVAEAIVGEEAEVWRTNSVTVAA